MEHWKLVEINKGRWFKKQHNITRNMGHFAPAFVVSG
jgi:hypothetical protein